MIVQPISAERSWTFLTWHGPDRINILQDEIPELRESENKPRR